MTEKETKKFTPSNVFEGMTSISALLGSTCDNDRTVERIWIDQSKKKTKEREIAFLLAKSKEMGFPVEFVTAEQIEEISVGSSHGGILAFCSDRHISTVCRESIREDGFYVYLEGIEDPYNFGYTVRSLYAAGVDGVLLPPRNWMSAAGVVARASAGASELIPMMTGSADEVVTAFRRAGYLILCAGIRDSVSIFEETLPLPALLVIGGEKRGISRNLLEKADRIVRIDYGRQFRGSLSAASAATVMAFEIMRKNGRFSKE